MAKARLGLPALRPNDLGLIAVAAAAFFLALGALTGIGVASFVFGGGWMWPRGVLGATRELGGLLAGNPTRGLDHAQAQRVPGLVAIWVTVAFLEVIVVAVALATCRWATATVRPSGARSALASRADAAAALGRRRLARSSQATAWPLGRSRQPRGIDLWVPYDRSTGVIGPQGSGKTLDVLAHAELAAPGGLLQTSTKADDVLLTLSRRSADDRPVAVCDPFGVLPGIPLLIWDPLAGCVHSITATRRAKAFTAGTVKGTAAVGGNDVTARFYAAEAAKVLQGYFHAAALTGRTLDHVMEWIADPVGTETAETILSQHPHAEQHWARLLRGSLRGAPDKVAHTVATVQQAMSLFMHSEAVRRCVPSLRHPATDIGEVIRRGGTIYLLGKDDPYTAVSPLLTAITDDVLDTAEHLASTSPRGRLAPPFVAALDELPSIAPIPTLPQRMADGPARDLTIVWAAQTWRQLVTCYGEDAARIITAITGVLVIFDGENDVPNIRLREIGSIGPRHAVVFAESSPAIIARLRPVTDGKSGAALLAAREAMRADVSARHVQQRPLRDLSAAALSAAHEHGLHADSAR